MSNMTIRVDGDATHCIDSVHLRRKVMGHLPSPLVDRSLNWGDRRRTLYAAEDRKNSRSKWEKQGDLAVGTGERADTAGACLTPTYALYEWTKAALPELNADVLARRSSVKDFLAAVQGALPVSENPTRCDLDECRRQLVVLGMIGSSLERHNQEDGRRPGEALAALQVGRWPFRRYIATLASRVGGPPRDSFQSFVMWNGSLVDVYLPGDTEPLLQFPNVFQSSPLTFSDDPAELLFLSLLKRCAALEAAANLLLWPLCEGLFELDDPAALTRVEDATVLMQCIRSEMKRFRHSKDFTAPFFLDVLRQYACAWDGEGSYSAPSGAHDVEYVVRDLLLGTPVSHLDDHMDDPVPRAGPLGTDDHPARSLRILVHRSSGAPSRRRPRAAIAHHDSGRAHGSARVEPLASHIPCALQSQRRDKRLALGHGVHIPGRTHEAARARRSRGFEPRWNRGPDHGGNPSVHERSSQACFVAAVASVA
jgi:hypothetical protein